MGACCTKTVDTTSKAVKGVAKLVGAISSGLGLFLYPKKDGNILRYYLGKVADILPFQEDDELLYLDGNVVVNKSPEEVTRTVNGISPGKPITIIGSRPTGQGDFIYNYVEGSFQEPLYPDLENKPERAAPLRFRQTASYTTSEPVFSLPAVRAGYIESWVHQGQYLKYDPLFGNVRILGGLNKWDSGFRFWRCPFVMLEHLRREGTGNPIREAFRPESLPLFLSASASGLSWEFRPAGQYGHPMQPSTDLLFSAVSLGSEVFGIESHHIPDKFVRMTNGGLHLDQGSPNASAEARFFFWDANADP